MKRFGFATVSLFTLVTLSGCATTNVINRQSDIGNARIPRPNHIVVYNFAATPDEISQGSPEIGQYGEPMQQSAQDVATGRQLGAAVASELVADIQAMGVPAASAAGVFPAPGDVVIKGYFASVDDGNAARRVMLGFGSGAANLRTFVIAYQMTPQGLRRLGSGEVDSGGGKSPGLLLPIAVAAATANPIGLVIGGAVKIAGEASGRDTIEGAGKRTAKEIADQLEIAFRKQGWIQ